MDQISEKTVERARKRIAYRKKIHIRLDDELHKRLRMKVAAEGTTIQRYIEDLLRKSLQ